MKKIVISIIIILGLGISGYYYLYSKEPPDEGCKDNNPVSTSLEEKVIVLFDPTIYEIKDSTKLNNIYELLVNEILLYKDLKHEKEFIFWVIEDQMISKTESHKTIFHIDTFAEKEKDQFPQYIPCKKDIESIIADKWQLKHKNKKETEKLASYIIESFYVLGSKYDLHEKTEIILISDMLQESKEYNMKLETCNDREEINTQFSNAIESLRLKDIRFDYSNIEGITIYQATSRKIETTEKAQAIKNGWFHFLNDFCNIDSTKISYHTNI